MEKQILEIIKQKDDYAYSAEMSQNAKGFGQLSIKIKFDYLDEAHIKKRAESILKELKEACDTLKIPIAGVEK